MSAAMYPKEAKSFFKFRQQYGPVDKLDTRHFLVGPEMGEEFDVDIEQGKTLSIKTLTPGLEVPSNFSFVNYNIITILDYRRRYEGGQL